MLNDPDGNAPRAKRTARPGLGSMRSSSSNARRVLTLRMLAAQTEWLVGPLRWQEGRVVWTHSRGTLAPSAADLSAAQRALHQVARYPHASDRAFGDGEAWLANRQARLEDAKQLHLLHASDLASLVGEASERGGQRGGQAAVRALQLLVELLSAEAMCLNALPESPARALLRIASARAGAVEEALGAFVDASTIPSAGRALAALVLGVLIRQDAGHTGSKGAQSQMPFDGRALNGGTSNGHTINEADAQWLHRAHRWGRARGLPTEPGLAVALLAERDGTELLQRWDSLQAHLATSRSGPCFTLPIEALRERMAGGEADGAADGTTKSETKGHPKEYLNGHPSTPHQILALCEAVASLQHVGVRCERAVLDELGTIEDRFEVRPERLMKWRNDLRTSCRELTAALADLTRQYALATGEASVVRSLGVFVGQMLDLQHSLGADLAGEAETLRRRRGMTWLGPPSPSGRPFVSGRDATAAARVPIVLLESALAVLRAGLALPCELHADYLSLLTERHARVWAPAGLTWGRRSRSPGEQFDYLRDWLRTRWTQEGQPLASLLRRSRSIEVCREAHEAGAHHVLSQWKLRDPALYRYALTSAQFLDATRRFWVMHTLCEALARCDSIREARTALGPALEALRPLARGQRGDVFCALLEAAGNTSSSWCAMLGRLVSGLAPVVDMATSVEDFNCYDALEALSALNAVARAEANVHADAQEPAHAQAHADVHGPSHEAVDLAAGTSEATPDDSSCEGPDPSVDAAQVGMGGNGIGRAGTGETGGTESKARNEQWLRWVLKERHAQENEDNPWSPARALTQLAATLAEGDTTVFQTVFRAAARQGLSTGQDHLERGLHALYRYPGLRALLGKEFPQHAARSTVPALADAARSGAKTES